MKTMCPPGYHHNGIVVSHALGHMMYGYTLPIPMNQKNVQQASSLGARDGLAQSFFYKIFDRFSL